MYKTSDFNYFVPEDDRIVYFNGISSEIFSLNQGEHQRMQLLLQDLELFENKYNTVFNRFKKLGFIIENDADEVELLKFRNRQAVYKDKHYFLVINPTLECNFKCWYCYEEHPQGHMPEEVKERIIKHIDFMIKEEKITSLQLNWFGGEPLLYFDEVVYPISEYAKKACEKADIPYFCGATTNASLVTREMVQQMKEIALFNFQITLDGDRNRHDKIRNENGQPSYDKIVNNVRLVAEQIEEAKITLRINYDAQTLEICDMEQIFAEIPSEIRHKISFDFQRVWQTALTIKGVNQTRISLFDRTLDLGYSSADVSNAFRIGLTHKCYADRYYHAEFNYDGKVYRCTACGYGDEYVMGELTQTGEIKWKEQSMAMRYAKSTFENEKCLVCKYLPLCMGLCSQKIVEIPKEKIDEVCYLNNAEVLPETVILDYYHRVMKASRMLS